MTTLATAHFVASRTAILPPTHTVSPYPARTAEKVRPADLHGDHHRRVEAMTPFAILSESLPCVRPLCFGRTRASVPPVGLVTFLEGIERVADSCTTRELRSPLAKCGNSRRRNRRSPGWRRAAETVTPSALASIPERGPIQEGDLSPSHPGSGAKQADLCSRDW